MNTNYFSSTDDREYPYTNLLDRIYHQLNEKNPNCFEQKSHKLPPPQTHLIGSKKTGWGNFNNICQKLGRKPDHVKQFFLAEMNTTGNLDGDGNLILKGRWRPKQFESLLKKYIREYIECQNCHSPITTLTKDNTTRLLFLTCTVCKSQRSVAPIKAGFHAVSKDDRRQAKKHAH
jgi:translation initiation factor 2 subunit 2